MNVFPCVVTLPELGRVTVARVVSDGRKVRVWKHWRGHEAANPQGFVLLAEAPASAITGTGPTWYVKTADGTITFRRDSTDCGCSDPLKNYTPTPDGARVHRVYTDPEVTDA